MFGKNAKIELLKGVPLFSDCSKRELTDIAQVADEIDFPAGRTLIEEGKPGREFFVIADGTVEVRRGGRKLPPAGDSNASGSEPEGFRRTSSVSTSRCTAKPDCPVPCAAAI